MLTVTEWVCVCLFSIGGHTVGTTELKFGMENHFNHLEVIGYIWAGYPHPWGQGALKRVYQGLYIPKGAFLWKFHKTKVEERPQFSQFSGGGSGQYQATDLTQVSSSRSKFKGGFPRHGSSAILAETLQRVGDPPRQGYSLSLDWVPQPQGRVALKCGSGVHAAQTMYGLLGLL